MEEQDKDAFTHAWLTPETQNALLKLAKRYAPIFHEEREDTVNRALDHILRSDRRFSPEDNALYLGDSVMRGLAANEKRKKGSRVTTALDDDDPAHDPPASGADAESRMIQKEREELKESLFADAVRTLGEGDVAERARGVLGCMRRGVDDASEIARELGIDVAQVRKARERLAETLRAAAKRRGKEVEALRGAP